MVSPAQWEVLLSLCTTDTQTTTTTSINPVDYVLSSTVLVFITHIFVVCMRFDLLFMQ